MRLRLVALIALAAFAVSAAPALAKGSLTTPAAKAGKGKCSLKKKAKCRKANLSKQKIGKVDLAGADLRGANLAGATLTGTTLTGANLTEANLSGVTLRDVDLRGADLSGAKLIGARIVGGDFSALASSRATGGFPVAQPSGCGRDRATCSDIPVAQPSGCGRDRGTCTGVNLSHAILTGTVVSGANMSGVNYEGSVIRGGSFQQSNLMSASFHHADISALQFANSDMRRVNFGSAVCDRCQWDGNDLTEANLGGIHGVSAPTRASLQASNPKVDGIRGLVPEVTVTVSGGGSPVYLREKGVWSNSIFCVNSVCRFKVYSGTVIDVEIPRLGSSSAAGFTCVASGALRTTCSGTVTADADLTLRSSAPAAPPPAAPPPVTTKTVSVSVADLSSTAVPVDAIMIQTVTATGEATATQACVNASSCSKAYPVGSWVRVTFSISSPTGHFLVLGNSAMTTLGPTPFVDLASPAFELTADTALTATIS